MNSNLRLIILLLMTIVMCSAVHITTDAASKYSKLRNRDLRSKGKGSKGSGSLKSLKSSSKGKGSKSSKSQGTRKGGKSSKSPGKGKGGKSSKSPSKGKGGKSSKSNKSSKSLKSNKSSKSLKNSANQGGGNDPELDCQDIQGLPCDDNLRRVCEIQQIASTVSDNVPNQAALEWLLNEDTNTNSCGGIDGIIQRYVLAVFFYETDGPNWKNKDGWIKPQNECITWRGIECNTDGRVTKIILESNRLRDAIPNELSKLPLLEELILFDNFFESLPTNIGSFSSLKKLDVERNRLFGTLFNADFANLADTLEYLLASNQQSNGGFTGTIPTYIRNFTKLKELALSRNRFSGSIPAQITELQSLEYLYLWENSFTGSIPENIGALTNLMTMDLSKNNQMSGIVPTSIIDLRNLQFLNLSDMNLEGNLPAIGNLDELRVLRMSNNNLSGPLQVLVGLTNLIQLDLESNNFDGAIPDLSTNQLIELIDLSRNRLSGDLPAWLFSLPNIKSLLLENNFITGNIPDNFGGNTSLIQLWLNNNLIGGVIPSLSSPNVLASIREIRLEFNDLNGSILLGSNLCNLVDPEKLTTLRTDCAEPNPEVICSCCTGCS